MYSKITSFFSSSVQIFYPEVCIGCGKAGHYKGLEICLVCKSGLPRLHMDVSQENPVNKVFYGRVSLKFAHSFLHYNKGGVVKSMIHDLKYGNRPMVGKYLGKLYALELRERNNLNFENAVLAPVPLHPEKFARRGYNQSEEIAKGVSEVFNLKVINSLIKRTHNNSSQTTMNRMQRVHNAQSLFQINVLNQKIPKDIILIDDVITTGSTIEACANAIHASYPETQVSVMSLAYSD